ncbi:MAG: flavodoxin family protein, partial [Bacillota bacterium]
MKVVAFNGSPNSEGNTYYALKIMETELKKENIDFEMIQVGNKKIRGCLACRNCVKTQSERCIIDDEVNGWIQKIKKA